MPPAAGTYRTQLVPLASILSWSYDRYGNRLAFSQNIAGAASNTTPSVDPATNRFVLGQSFTYDKNGNVVGDIDSASTLPRTFIFNGDNKQTEVKKDGVTVGRYYYDGEGKRVKKHTDTETTVFVYSAGKLIAEYSTATPPSNPTISYTTTDHLGSPRIITDAVGQVKSRRDFLPFGEDLFINVGARSTALGYDSSADDIRQKFTGYQKDSETNLDFAEARMYENRFGRYTAVDPLLASGKSANPQSFNRYIYVGNNPLFWIDRNGEIWGRADDGRVRWFAKKLGGGFTEFTPENWQYVGKNNQVIELDPNSSKWRPIEPVQSVAEYNPSLDFVMGFKKGAYDARDGSLKGLGNLGVDGANQVTDAIFNPQKLLSFGFLLLENQNPLQMERFSYDSQAQRNFGKGVEFGLPAGLSLGGSVFAGSSSLSITREFNDLYRAEKLRDATMIEKGRTHATYVGGYKDGRIAVGCSSNPMGCAEADVTRQLGEGANFTEALGWRKGAKTSIRVCTICQEKYSRSQFLENVQWRASGTWGHQ